MSDFFVCRSGVNLLREPKKKGSPKMMILSGNAVRFLCDTCYD